MNSLKFYIILLPLLTLAILTLAQEDANYLYHNCQNATTSTINSTYRVNLNLLLSSLASNATLNNTIGFYNTSFGKNTDQVYGLFICRGDLSNTVCQNCVTFATEDIVQRCPIGIASIVYYDACILRYSNRNIFSKVDQSPGFSLLNTQNITTEPQRFNNLVGATANDLAARAASAPPGAKKFAVNKTSFNAFQNIYSLAQCTPDLSSSDCNRCLSAAIAGLPNCCSSKIGGRVLFPSCYIHYEITVFYNATAVAAESPPPPPPPVVLPSPPTPRSPEEKGGVPTVLIMAIVIPFAVSIALFCMCFCFLRRARKTRDYVPENDVGDEITTEESLQFDLSTIEAATNNFSADNKLGEGGFGEVYKGTLPNGHQIAVKRLSKNSGQGAAEFKNEVVLVAKLQHRNLVRVQGFCLDGEEKILVYEFVSNKSLDYFLYDHERQGLLDWSRRYKIIGGIARGILYLHEDSRLRIIHRDLKASNILLDGDMNPKISDFGLARIFVVDQTQASTNRIVGTYGYMSPEYAMHGRFSVKSDVYSFGVLILEIITGKKNSSFYQTGGAADLVSYVWKHWRDGTPLEVLDPTLTDTYSRNEVIRCLHIGLLCVQEDPAIRPAMATIVLTLNSYSVTLPSPQEPAFFFHSTITDELNSSSKEFLFEHSKSKSVAYSVDEASITEVYPR
ncbi:cysteine-rich receptor-like protein kinase 10 isoform X1 [Populus nigra]|uniref:cysteine-rich receptor-like protein kinase 10 isoform X1 n=1 Tax=Populus nigra TaxID=3691 RepID=UPI002B26F629|nr:cysteine-rich receptor-like protein kinase 10 isoform X1 [Populus nigra]